MTNYVQCANVWVELEEGGERERKVLALVAIYYWKPHDPRFTAVFEAAEEVFDGWAKTVMAKHGVSHDEYAEFMASLHAPMAMDLDPN